MRNQFPSEGLGQARFPERVTAAWPAADAAPHPHTTAEVDAIISFARSLRAGWIAIGTGRHPASTATSAELIRRWADAGGEVTALSSWPDQAASWLRPAQRLVDSGAQAHVIIDNPLGAAQLLIRLAEHEAWTSHNTILTASAIPDTVLGLLVDHPRSHHLWTQLVGLHFATPDGEILRLNRSWDLTLNEENRGAGRTV